MNVKISIDASVAIFVIKCIFLKQIFVFNI